MQRAAMTLEQFRETGRGVANLGDEINDARWEGEPPAPGRIYIDALYIESVTTNWPEHCQRQGKWYLILDRDEYISDDLSLLESKLYEWAIEWGYFE